MTLRDRARELGVVPWVTLAAMMVVAAAFLAELALGVDGWRPSAAELAAVGADPDAGGAWRLAIAPLVHLGIAHLAFNLIGFALVGPPLERRAGHAATAVVFVGGAVLGAAVHLAAQPYDLSIGASGATFAAAAALLIVVIRAPARPVRGDAIRLAVFVALGAIAMAASALSSFGAETDGWAHAGGAAAGIVTALVARGPLRTAAAAIALAATTALVLTLAPPAIDWRGDLARAALLERRFDAIVPETLDAPAPELADRVRAEVIAPLAALRDGLRDDSRLPPAIAHRRGALRAYLDARLRAFRAIASFLATGDARGRADFEAANKDADRALAAP